MSRFKYVTPQWVDVFNRDYDYKKEFYIDSRITTDLHFLNDNNEENTLTIYFYDSTEQVRIDSVIQRYHSHYLRIADHMENIFPNYIDVSNSRMGWLKIISSNRLHLSGKISQLQRKDNSTIKEICWTIPFFETQLIDPKQINQDPIEDVSNEPLFKKIPRPFPR